jgi:gamma-glutamyltranspeptidase
MAPRLPEVKCGAVARRGAAHPSSVDADKVFVERGLSPDTIRLLEAKGHGMITTATLGSANSILLTPEGLTGAADPRQRGTLAEGFEAKPLRDWARRA